MKTDKVKDIALLEVLIEDLKTDEGYRQEIYDDATGEKIDWVKARVLGIIKGHPTVGYGHNVEARKFSDDILSKIFLEDIKRAMRQAENNFDFYSKLSINRRRVIVNMIFNMGLWGVKGFRNMIKAVENEDYETASDEMLNSLWARTETTALRARKLSELMLAGNKNLE